MFAKLEEYMNKIYNSDKHRVDFLCFLKRKVDEYEKDYRRSGEELDLSPYNIYWWVNNKYIQED